MERALFVAERGRGRTTPNPIVGAVVVSPAGIVVGQGAHLQAGGPHAEVVALDAAGDSAAGATLYCTLEPCSHAGRTGPCAVRIVEAGVRRVVAAVRDPNPSVAGEGYAYLRHHGVEVSEHVGEAAASLQHAPFFTWIGEQRPFVTAKTAVSRDGFVGRAGTPTRLTGPDADRYFQRQRAEVDAIMVGSRTVLVDDPLLTARGAYRYRPLARVLVDWNGQIRPESRVFSTLGAGPVIMFVSGQSAAQGAAWDALRTRGVVVERLPARSLSAALMQLATRDIVSLLVEGGPALQSALFDAGLVDRLQWIDTPVTLSGGVAASKAAAAIRAASRPDRTRDLGEDRLLEFDVHRPH